MLETPTQHQQQVWVAQRLYRICVSLRDQCSVEPCLEQYERHVQLIMGEAITPAAAAWIEVIAQRLRSNAPFSANEYIPAH